MEFNEIVVKESPGLCRCCLSEGCYKDLGSEYTWMNEAEVYADMLLECFDISITQHNEGPNGPSRLICEVCITRLRDACNFKKQVLDSEKKFIDMLGRGEFRPKVLIYQTQMKTENSDEQVQEEVEYLEDDLDFDDDEVLKPSVDEHSSSPLETVTSETISLKRKLKTKKTKISRPKKHVEVDEKPKSSKAVSKGEPRGGQKRQRLSIKDGTLIEENIGTQPSRKPAAKEKRFKLRNNIVAVLKNSTVMPFRWLKSSYRCFYCYDIFQEAAELKSHQQKHEGDEVIVQTVNNYWETTVYVDVSNISCKLCSVTITDIYDLIDHLVSKHGISYSKEFNCLLAFRLDNTGVSCVSCGAKFYTFGPLLLHTNKEHKGPAPILCDVCGQHCKDANLLKLHFKTVHENSGLLCTECGEKFETRSKLKTHQKNLHDIDKKFKCLICPEMFQSHYKRSRHMAAEHKNRQEIKCLHCPKTFVFRSMMMAHVRDTHLKVRNYVCGVCGWKAFNSNRLKNHMFKHSGEKNFKCEGCDKAFTTKKIMRAHYARMHKNVSQPIMPYDNYVGH